MTDVLHFCFYVNIATLRDNSKKICGLTFTFACVRGSLGFFFFPLCFVNRSGMLTHLGIVTFFKFCSSLNVVRIKRWLNNKLRSPQFVYCAEISLNISHMCRWDQL